jgi:hypothetical protein
MISVDVRVAAENFSTLNKMIAAHIRTAPFDSAGQDEKTGHQNREGSALREKLGFLSVGAGSHRAGLR